MTTFQGPCNAAITFLSVVDVVLDGLEPLLKVAESSGIHRGCTSISAQLWRRTLSDYPRAIALTCLDHSIRRHTNARSAVSSYVSHNHHPDPRKLSGKNIPDGRIRVIFRTRRAHTSLRLLLRFRIKAVARRRPFPYHPQIQLE